MGHGSLKATVGFESRPAPPKPRQVGHLETIGENSMQAWQQAKVMNHDSEHANRAGLVVRVEKAGDAEIVYINLDADEKCHAEVVSFADSELVIL